MMNGRDPEGSVHSLFWALSRNVPRRTEENHERLESFRYPLPEIQTERLPITATLTRSAL
jgi:hypothetical protein